MDDGEEDICGVVGSLLFECRIIHRCRIIRIVGNIADDNTRYSVSLGSVGNRASFHFRAQCPEGIADVVFDIA